MILEICALSLIEDCVISLNHLSRGDYSMGAKFQNGCFAFCLFYAGIDKRNGKKLNFKEHKICYYIKFCVTLFKERCEGFVGCISEPVNFWRKSTVYVDAINPNNCNGVVSRIKRIDYRIQERLSN